MARIRVGLGSRIRGCNGQNQRGHGSGPIVEDCDEPQLTTLVDLPTQFAEPPTVEPSFGIICTIPRSFLVSSLYFTAPSGEVSIFFLWRDHVSTGQYHISLHKVRQK
ncbi:hypothetical protein J1N35_015091 [Gossypium stocksii]|uniref:Uncharacterized protein n=1 Tax=Gossypium stocksii TaxID=47602 RepID=A0A9D3VVA2_9ROSI|nr:hypothetical protein J1N35_015091 [Gossypium stocksii]